MPRLPASTAPTAAPDDEASGQGTPAPVMGPAPLSYPGVRTLELRERAARRRLFHVMDLMRQEFETASWVPFPAILERASPRWRNVYALRREQLDMVRKKLETKRLETGSQD